MDELTTTEETQAVQTSHHHYMPKLEDNLPQTEQNITYNSKEQEEEEHQDTNKTGAATPAAPWDYLPYGHKTRSQAAFLWQKHKSQLKHARQQDTSY